MSEDLLNRYFNPVKGLLKRIQELEEWKQQGAQSGVTVAAHLRGSSSGTYTISDAIGSGGECGSFPCLHDGTCEDLPFGYRCLCPSGYGGSNCEIETISPSLLPLQGVSAEVVSAMPVSLTASVLNNAYPNPVPSSTELSIPSGSATLHTGVQLPAEDTLASPRFLLRTLTAGAFSSSPAMATQPPDDTAERSMPSPSQIMQLLATPTSAIPPTWVSVTATAVYAAEQSTTVRREVLPTLSQDGSGSDGECQSFPCLHGGTCEDFLFAYRCLCPSGYEGSNCEIEATTTSSSSLTVRRFSAEDVSGTPVVLTATFRSNGYLNLVPSAVELPTSNGSLSPSTAIQSLPEDTLASRRFFIRTLTPYGFGPSPVMATQPVPPDDTSGMPLPSPKRITSTATTTSLTIKPSPTTSPAIAVPLTRDSVTVTAVPTNDFSGTIPPEVTPTAFQDASGSGGECGSFPCVHGGTCEDLHFAYRCLCPPGYEGSNCQIEVNECDSNPCLNSGTCLEQINAYLCECAKGFTGENCGEVIRCRSLNVQVGSVLTNVSDDTSVGSVVRFSCSSVCYTLDGLDSIQCQPDGTWNGTEPQCNLKTCPDLVSPTNGEKNSSDFTCGSTVEFSCNECYELEGSKQLFCQDNGTWNGSEPKCTLIDCGPLEAPGNGSISNGNTTCGQTISFTCDKCYTLTNSSHNRTCLSTGNWSGSHPACEYVYCPLLQDLANGSVVVTEGYPSCGSAASFRCRDSFGLIGSVYRECVTGGNWNGVPASCHDISLLTIQLREVWSLAPVHRATVTITVVDSINLTRYRRIAAREDTLLFEVPAEVQVLASAEADGYMPASMLFFTHHSTDILPLYMRRKPDPVFVQIANGSDVNVAIPTVDDAIRLYIPTGAISGRHLNVTVSTVNLTDSLHGVPQFIGVTERNTFEESFRSNLDVYTAVYVDAKATDGNRNDVDIITAIYLAVPFVFQEVAVDEFSTWSYNESHGVWQRVGIPEVEEQTLMLEISSFGWWAVAVPWTDTSCTSVRVSRTSSTSSTPSPLLESVVSLTGYDYSYFSVGGTDAAGLACVEQKSHRSSILHVENERFSVKSGAIMLRSSNGSACDEEQHWLGSSDWQGKCSRLEILFADCGPLPSPSNGSVYDPTVVSVLGDVGRPAVASFACEVGFQLVGQLERTCLSNGTWSGSQPSCKSVTCDDLAVPANGIRHGEMTTYGTTVFFSCDVGHFLTGSSNRTCQADGMWSGTDAVCNARDCGQFSAVENGRIEGNQTTFPSILVFSCDEGFEIAGSSISQCQENGLWNPAAVRCDAVSCGGLPDVDNGRKIGSFGFNLTFECNPCYRLEGSTSRICQADKTWSGTQPTCNLIHCPPLNAPQNGEKTGNETSCSSTVMFTCNRNYRLIGSNSRTCQENETWSGQQPTCDLVHCNELPSPRNGVKLGNETEVNSRVLFSCDDCFRLEGASNLTCLYDGRWNKQQPTCEMIHCKQLASPSNGIKLGSETRCAFVTQFKCNSRYKLIGSDQRICQENGIWSGEQPICRVSDCGDLGPVENGLPTVGNTTTVGSVKTFRCNQCFELRGSRSLVCQESGVWNGSLPTCNLVKCAALPDPENGFQKGTSTVCGSVVTLHCFSGYQRVGNSSRMCAQNGEWTGAQPQCVEINECLSWPCQNGATCIDEIDGYTCFCPSTYRGTLCETPTTDGSCSVQDCHAFLEVSDTAFHCGGTSYIDEFMTPFCTLVTHLATSSPARDWARKAWGCMVKVAVQTIESVYGGYQSDGPLQWQCQEFDRRAFAIQQHCLQEDFCNTPFTSADSRDLVDAIESSGVFRDRNFQQILDILDDCGQTNGNVAPLRDEMLRRGFVLCFTADNERNRTATVEQAVLFIYAVSDGEGKVQVLTDADEVCTAPRSEFSVAVALLSNGTGAVSQDNLCDGRSTAAVPVTLQCPVCGNGVLELPGEACDDGNEARGDGCSSECMLEEAFACTTIPWEKTVCKHFAIDLNKFDNTTRNRSIITSHINQVVFLADNSTLDASDYGNQDWERATLKLTWAASVLEEKLDYSSSLDVAVSTGRLTASERDALLSAVYEETRTEGSTVQTDVFRRPGERANLTHVLLAVSYRHVGQQDLIPRLILIEVLDINGLSAPPVGVTVTYTGKADTTTMPATSTPPVAADVAYTDALSNWDDDFSSGLNAFANFQMKKCSD